MQKKALSVAAAVAVALGLTGSVAHADMTPFNLASGNFFQDWSNTSLITTNDNWSGVPSITGYLGDINPSIPTNTDPRTLTNQFLDLNTATVDVIANQNSPNTLTTGGVAEFESLNAGSLAQNNPTVALQGSGTADAPFLALFLNSLGRQTVQLTYNLRDVDGSADDADQQIDVQFRVGNAGNWTSVPGAYIPDVTLGPNLTSAGTGPIQFVLPASVNNQSLVQVRWITTNAGGSDEWVGVDDIQVTSQPFTGSNVAPEPGTFALLLPALAGGVAVLRRKRAA